MTIITKEIDSDLVKAKYPDQELHAMLDFDPAVTNIHVLERDGWKNVDISAVQRCNIPLLWEELALDFKAWPGLLENNPQMTILTYDHPETGKLLGAFIMFL